MGKETYKVVVHYEGACVYTVQADSETEAKQIASNLFEGEEPAKILESIDWDICDCWKKEEEEK